MEIKHYCKVCGKQLTGFETECSRCASPTGYASSVKKESSASEAGDGGGRECTAKADHTEKISACQSRPSGWFAEAAEVIGGESGVESAAEDKPHNEAVDPEEVIAVPKNESGDAEGKWTKRGSALLWAVIVVIVLLAAVCAAVYLGLDGNIPFDDITRLFGGQ